VSSSSSSALATSSASALSSSSASVSSSSSSSSSAAAADPHAANRQRFYQLMDAGNRQGALEHVARAYNMAPDDATYPYALAEAPNVKDSNHATTRGGYRESGRRRHGTSVTFNRTYLDAASGGDAAARERHFANVVHSLYHEHTHVRQRASAGIMQGTNRQLREYQAYAAEVLNDAHLPPRPAEDTQARARKALRNYRRARRTEKYKALPRSVRRSLRAAARPLRTIRDG
jgi:hypothetical protein